MTSPPEAAPFQDVGALRARKRVLDLLAVSTLLATFLAAAIPWFLQALPLDLAPAARAALAFTLVYWASAAAADRLRRPLGLLIAILALQSSAVIFLALFWHLLGGLQSPTLLLAFLLPTLGAGLLLRPWHAASLALLSILAVGLLAMAESPELRWYLSRLGLPGLLARALPALPRRPEPFPGVDSSPAYLFVLLEAFAVLELACMAALPPLVRLLRRLLARPAAPALLDAGVLRTALLESAVPTALVDAEDGRILLASEGFSRRMLLQRSRCPRPQLQPGPRSAP